MPSQPDRYGAAYRGGCDKSKTQRIFELFQDATKDFNKMPRTLLDVGCGDGTFLDLAHQDGWEVCGIDADSEAVQLSRSRGLSVSVGTLGESLPARGRFNAVTLWDVIEHIEDLEEAMSWLASAIVPNGRLILLTPNAHSLLDSIAHFERTVLCRKSQRMMHLCLNRYHVHRFTMDGLTQMVRRFGFVPEQTVTLQLFSLRPDRYLSGFAPGMPGWTPSASLNSLMSQVCFQAIRMSGIRNKLFFNCRKSDVTPNHAMGREMLSS